MISSSPVKTLPGPGWILLLPFLLLRLLSAAPVSSEETIYAKEGGKVTLKPKPGSVSDATKSIIWKIGNDMVVDLDPDDLAYYGRFKARSNLNNRTGELTITDLTFDLTGVYNIEIDNTPIDHKINLFVLAPVPVPSIASSCPEGTNTCDLICEGNTVRAEPVTYIWMTDNAEVSNSSNKIYTVKGDSSGVREFSCKMKNPVSEGISKPFSNPFKAVQSGPRISTGITVLVVLLFLVILVAIGHRMKTGEWFFNKPSMPWEKDFWRNTMAQESQAAALESNGNTTPLKDQSDEVTAVRD
uniref:LFA3 n=1 Tax=Poeciliopsis prolifica TaxID=188132 RepID=A0A0S7F4C5_9TELE